MELLDLDGVIEKGVFEIPSYQRGYAWQMRQLKVLERFRACVQTGKPIPLHAQPNLKRA
ncbi:hypothetical protein HpMS199_14910 [Helicobacter pylori]